MRRSTIFVGRIGLALLFLLIGDMAFPAIQTAQARWKSVFSGSQFSTWYAQQHDYAGWSCCDRSDAHAVHDAYIKNGLWHVPIEGIDHEVNWYQVLDGPNPTGHGVIWYTGSGKHVNIFCFAPGPLS